MTTKALLVDGNNILARSVHASKSGKAEMSVAGVNTSALLLFINQISRYVKIVEPTHVLVCWDKGHTKRDEIHPGYKATRVKHESDEDEAETPWGQAREFCTWAGIPHLALGGWEADDLIASVCVSRPDIDKVILSGDKDLLQLVDETTTQIRPPDAEQWTIQTVWGKFGVRPEHLPHYLALVGDPGDCVPGVAGIGPKKAVKRLEEADWVWERALESLSPEQADQATMSRSLVDLRHPSFALHVEGLAMVVPKLQPFIPTTPGSMLWMPFLDFLERWQMKSVQQRVVDGTLWQKDPAEPTTEGSAEMFAGLDL